MFIGIAALAFATALSIGPYRLLYFFGHPYPSFVFSVIRCILVRQNRQLEQEELANLKGAKRERIEDAARLEGITFEEALRRKKGFRYLY